MNTEEEMKLTEIAAGLWLTIKIIGFLVALFVVLLGLANM